MPGPAPNPNARRPRNGASDGLPAYSQAKQLPSEGRKGRAPKWPLSRMVAGEKQIWTDLWGTPQAVAWERLGWTRTVARYARVLGQAEKPDASPAILNQARQLEDSLGMSPKAMLALRWKIAEDELAGKRPKPKPQARRNLKAVDTG